jgi:hypothetical protein
MKTNWWLKSGVANWMSLLGLAGVSLIVPTAQAARMAIPGTVNYVEGQVSLNGSDVGARQSGDLAVESGQILSTGQGKAEVLLSPGAYLRVGSNSEIQMLGTGLTDPRVEVVAGEAMLEVDAKPKMAGLDVMVRGADASILTAGLYKFDAGEGQVAVIDGKLRVTQNGQAKEFGKGKEVALNGGALLKPVGFDRKAEDELYRWSDVRSGYEAEVNAASAQNVYINGGWGMGYGPGWFWNPYFDTFAWLPGDGFFMSPFGYPFFSPGYAIYVPRYYGGGTFLPRPRGVLAGRPVGAPGFRSGIPSARVAGGGFAGRGFAGGGFHGGGRR